MKSTKIFILCLSLVFSHLSWANAGDKQNQIIASAFYIADYSDSFTTIEGSMPEDIKKSKAVFKKYIRGEFKLFKIYMDNTANKEIKIDQADSSDLAAIKNVLMLLEERKSLYESQISYRQDILSGFDEIIKIAKDDLDYLEGGNTGEGGLRKQCLDTIDEYVEATNAARENSSINEKCASEGIVFDLEAVENDTDKCLNMDELLTKFKETVSSKAKSDDIKYNVKRILEKMKESHEGCQDAADASSGTLAQLEQTAQTNKTNKDNEYVAAQNEVQTILDIDEEERTDEQNDRLNTLKGIIIPNLERAKDKAQVCLDEVQRTKSDFSDLPTAGGNVSVACGTYRDESEKYIGGVSNPGALAAQLKQREASSGRYSEVSSKYTRTDEGQWTTASGGKVPAGDLSVLNGNGQYSDMVNEAFDSMYNGARGQHDKSLMNSVSSYLPQVQSLVDESIAHPYLRVKLWDEVIGFLKELIGNDQQNLANIISNINAMKKLLIAFQDKTIKDVNGDGVTDKNDLIAVSDKIGILKDAGTAAVGNLVDGTRDLGAVVTDKIVDSLRDGAVDTGKLQLLDTSMIRQTPELVRPTTETAIVRDAGGKIDGGAIKNRLNSMNDVVATTIPDAVRFGGATTIAPSEPSRSTSNGITVVGENLSARRSRTRETIRVGVKDPQIKKIKRDNRKSRNTIAMGGKAKTQKNLDDTIENISVSGLTANQVPGSGQVGTTSKRRARPKLEEKEEDKSDGLARSARYKKKANSIGSADYNNDSSFTSGEGLKKRMRQRVPSKMVASVSNNLPELKNAKQYKDDVKKRSGYRRGDRGEDYSSNSADTVEVTELKDPSFQKEMKRKAPVAAGDLPEEEQLNSDLDEYIMIDGKKLKRRDSIAYRKALKLGLADSIDLNKNASESIFEQISDRYKKNAYRYLYDGEVF
jgi:hypothetical protein